MDWVIGLSLCSVFRERDEGERTGQSGVAQGILFVFFMEQLREKKKKRESGERG